MASEWADPYTVPARIPGTRVLANKHGILDAEALKQFEYEQTALRIAELRERPIRGNFDLDHLKAIHAYIFQDVYEWAGKPRVVNLSKGGSSFARVRDLEIEGARLADSIARDKNLRGLAKPQFVDKLARCYTQLNALHPFREGNGRSSREFVGLLAREAGYELDQTRIDNGKSQWNEAARRSMTGDLAGVKAIFSEAIRPSRALAFDKLPEAEALAKYPELEGVYQALRGVRESLAQRYPDNERARGHFMQQAREEMIRRLDAGKVPALARVRPADQVAERSAAGASFEAVRASAAGQDLPPRARAFQAVADNALSRDDALKLYPELRPSFNQLSVAELRFANAPAQLRAVREDLQARLNAGEIPAPARAARHLQPQEMQR
jgi:cell filamentation protein